MKLIGCPEIQLKSPLHLIGFSTVKGISFLWGARHLISLSVENEYGKAERMDYFPGWISKV